MKQRQKQEPHERWKQGQNVNAVNELDSSKKNKNESDKKEYEFPDDVYHSCYTLTSNKEETFRFDQFTRGALL